MADGGEIAPASSAFLRLFGVRVFLSHHRVAAYLIAIAFAAMAIAVRLMLGTKALAPLLPFYPAVLAATFFGGRGPAYVCAATAGGGAWYVLHGSFEGGSPQHPVLLTIAVFSLLVVLVIEMVEGLCVSMERLRRQETLLRQRTVALQEREAHLSDSLSELQALYDDAPIGLAFMDRELRFVRINAALAEINGFPVEDHIGRSAWDLVPALRSQAEPMLRRVIDQDEPLVDVQISGETAAQPGISRIWMEQFYPVHGADGSVRGVGLFCQEITEARRAEERERLLTREVDHRAKNVLAVVQAVIRLTRSTSSVAEFKAAVEGRILALSRVHNLLASSRWDGVDLRQLIADEVAAFAGAVTIAAGDRPVILRPAAAQSLSLVMHELATNSAKHGALSAGGQVEIGWTVPRPDQERLTISWGESGGPVVQPSGRTGFGSSLIRMSVERQMGGELSYDLRPEGLTCEMSLPISVMAATALHQDR